MRRRIILIPCSMLIVAWLGSIAIAQAPSCTFSVSPESLYFFDVLGGTAGVQVKAPAPACTFTAKTQYPWISIFVKQERGEGNVSVTVRGNDSLAHRVGSLLIDGKEVAVVQYGPRRSGAE